jgi:hypothetical protein
VGSFLGMLRRYIGDNLYIAGVFTILVIPDNQLSPYLG